jgi:hypothetical protein
MMNYIYSYYIHFCGHHDGAVMLIGGSVMRELSSLVSLVGGYVVIIVSLFSLGEIGDTK